MNEGPEFEEEQMSENTELRGSRTGSVPQE